MWKYTMVDHEIRIRFEISMNEYAVLEIIRHSQDKWKYSVDGRAKVSVRKIAAFLGLSVGGVKGMLDRMVDKNLLEVDGEYKRVSDIWIEAHSTAQESGIKNGKRRSESEHKGVRKVNGKCSESEQDRSESEHNNIKNKKEGKGKVKPAPDFSFENIKDAVLKYLNKAYKKTDLLSLVEGTNQTVPELLEEVAAHWAGDGRTFDPNLYGDQKGLDTSLKNFAANNLEKEGEAETKFERVSDRVEQVIEIFKKYSPRILSERAKAASEEMIRRLLKKGETLEDFDRAFSRIKNGKSEWRDMEKALKEYETLKSIGSDAA